MNLLRTCAVSTLTLLVLAACSAGDGNGGNGSLLPGGGDGDGDGGLGVGDGDGDGSGSGAGGANADCDAELVLTIRDFKPEHVDFESYQGLNDIGCGMVAPDIGAENKPTFVSGIGTEKRVTEGDWSNLKFKECADYSGWVPDPVITSAESFDDWYHDKDGINQTFEVTVNLTDDGTGNYVYDNSAFFPIDGEGWGNNPGMSHNFGFTTEAHLEFGYIAGQKFTFRGDDDLWIFVNGKLALDLGGTHMPIEATLDFDKEADRLGIRPNNTYRMDIFHAERFADESNFRIETNISCFTSLPVIR